MLTYCQNHPRAMIQVSYFGSSCAVNGISGHSSIIFNFEREEETDGDVDLSRVERFWDRRKVFTPKEETVLVPVNRMRAA